MRERCLIAAASYSWRDREQKKSGGASKSANNAGSWAGSGSGPQKGARTRDKGAEAGNDAAGDTNQAVQSLLKRIFPV
jgi:hypothetical protein